MGFFLMFICVIFITFHWICLYFFLYFLSFFFPFCRCIGTCFPEVSHGGALSPFFFPYMVLTFILIPPPPSHSIGVYKAHDLVDPLSTFKNRNQTFSQCNVPFFNYVALFMH